MIKVVFETCTATHCNTLQHTAAHCNTLVFETCILVDYSFLDGYCSTVQGLLDWFEVDLGFTELSCILVDYSQNVMLTFENCENDILRMSSENVCITFENVCLHL